MPMPMRRDGRGLGRRGPGGPGQEGPRRPVRVGLYGGFGTGNTGNDATAAVAVEHLRRTQPDLDLRLITYGPETVAIADRLGVPTVSTQQGSRHQGSRHPGSWPLTRGVGARWAQLPLGPVRRPAERVGRRLRDVAGTWTTLRSVDAVVVLGCGIFEAESTVGGRGWRSMAHLYLVSLAASLGPHRLAYVGIGGTVLPTRAERMLVVAAMSRADHRTFRDAESKAALAQMGGGHPDDLVVADLVFAADLLGTGGRHAMPGAEAPPRPVPASGATALLDPSDSTDDGDPRATHDSADDSADDPAADGAPPAAPSDARHGADPIAPDVRPHVALGVMSFAWLHRHDGTLCPQDGYLRALAETAATLVHEGRDVVVFAGDVADRGAVDVVADAARAQLGDPGDHVATLYATTLTDQVPVLAAAEMVIGSRFHNAVSALMVGKAPLVVADRTKVRTLMRTMGLDDQVLEARTVTSSDLLELVARARAERAATEARTAVAVAAARAGSLRGLDDLDQLVQRWAGAAPGGARTGVGSATSTDVAAGSDVSVA